MGRALRAQQYRLRFVCGMCLLLCVTVCHEWTAQGGDGCTLQSELSSTPSPLALECARQPPLLCEGHIRVGWVDPARLRPQRIPADLLALLAGSDWRHETFPFSQHPIVP